MEKRGACRHGAGAWKEPIHTEHKLRPGVHSSCRPHSCAVTSQWPLEGMGLPHYSDGKAEGNVPEVPSQILRRWHLITPDVADPGSNGNRTIESSSWRAVGRCWGEGHAVGALLSSQQPPSVCMGDTLGCLAQCTLRIVHGSWRFSGGSPLLRCADRRLKPGPPDRLHRPCQAAPAVSGGLCAPE